MVTIEWQDAPAFYMEECVGKKDTFDSKALNFLEMFEVVHIEACGMCLRKNAMLVTLSLIVFLDRQDCLGSYMHHS